MQANMHMHGNCGVKAFGVTDMGRQSVSHSSIWLGPKAKELEKQGQDGLQIACLPRCVDIRMSIRSGASTPSRMFFSESCRR